ncbi:hypothetical protein NL676_008131 [Syzygium grande]|nr:hypothetical protein NL676_008131 [Syzygium grande]
MDEDLNGRLRDDECRLRLFETGLSSSNPKPNRSSLLPSLEARVTENPSDAHLLFVRFDGDLSDRSAARVVPKLHPDLPYSNCILEINRSTPPKPRPSKISPTSRERGQHELGGDPSATT